MAVSVFDIFKIGIGPSSSHTVGPMRAARMFVHRLQAEGLIARVSRVRCELFGSLGATGKGHGSDTAVLLGLCGHDPETVDVDQVPAMVQAVREAGRIRTIDHGQVHEWAFHESKDLVFHRRATLPFHVNGMSLTACADDGSELTTRRYYSVGGGFVVSEELAADAAGTRRLHPTRSSWPFPFTAPRNCWPTRAPRACPSRR